MAGKCYVYFLCIVLAVVTMVLTGCAKTPIHPQPVSTPIAISDFKTVAGKWEGLVSAGSQQDWLQVIIHENGNFEALSRRGFIGAFTSQGTLQIRDGKLRSGADTGNATYTLHEKDGKRILEFAAITSKGIRHSGKLSPAQ